MAEKLSVVMARRHIRLSDIVLLMIDATEGITAPDATIGGYAHEEGKSVIILINKWDMIKDKRAAARIYLEQAKDTKNTVDDIYAMISASDYAYTLMPQKVGKTAEFMYKIGSIKTRPASWKDLFFPEVQNLPGD
jgi:predicted GTPase